MANEKRGRTFWDFMAEADDSTIFLCAFFLLAVVVAIGHAVIEVYGK
jgi:hypothetical protein